jgi:hypothetical protein
MREFVTIAGSMLDSAAAHGLYRMWQWIVTVFR